MKPIRNSAKAIIIKDGKLLCTKNTDPEGFWYLLPGGGLEPGEPITDALKRECREEISAEIVIGDIRFIRDYIGKNHEFAEYDADAHQIEFMFSCSLVEGTEIKNGEIPDSYQVGIEWLPLDRLHEYRLYPKAMIPLLSSGCRDDEPVYLGDVN